MHAHVLLAVARVMLAVAHKPRHTITRFCIASVMHSLVSGGSDRWGTGPCRDRGQWFPSTFTPMSDVHVADSKWRCRCVPLSGVDGLLIACAYDHAVMRNLKGLDRSRLSNLCVSLCD